MTVDMDPDACTAAVNYTATATGSPTPSLTYEFSGATTASGNGTGSGSVFNKDITTVTITASNEILPNAICSFTVTVTDNQMPVISCPVARELVGCNVSAITGPAYSAAGAASGYAEFSDGTNQGAATDNCPITAVSYVDVADGDCPIVVTRTWTLSDGVNSTNCNQTITITPVEVYFVGIPPGATLQCSDPAPTSTFLSYTNDETGDCEVSGSVPGVITDLHHACGGSYTEEWTFTDACNRTITASRTYIVEPALQAAFDGVSDTGIPCAAAPPTASALFFTNNEAGVCEISGSEMSTFTGVFTDCGGSYIESWENTDACNRTIYQYRTVSVAEAPEASFESTPGNITIACAAAPPPSSSLSYDNGGTGTCAITGSVTGLISGSHNTCGGAYLEEWTFTDNCGRTITTSRTITVDPAPGAAFETTSDIDIDCDDEPPTGTPLSYSNGETGECAISGTVTGVITNDPHTGTYTETWTEYICGNPLTTSRIIHVLPLLSASISVTDNSGTANDMLICQGGSANLTAAIDGGTAPYTYSWSPNIGSDAGPHTVMPGSTTTYNITITDANGCMASAGKTITVITCTGIPISGTIKWHRDLLPGVKDAAVKLTGDATANGLTDGNGNYSFNPVSGANFVIKPSKNINRLNGVSTADAVAIQQHLTLINPITDPYEQIAADVNRNNSLSTFDATLINQCLLGNPAANAIFSVFWRFVPRAQVLSLPPWGFPEQIDLNSVSGPITGQDFYGVKIGDVVSTFANPANFGGGEPPALVWLVEDEVLQAGKSVMAEFTSRSFANLAAWQFALRFDPMRLEPDTIESLAILPLGPDNFGLYNMDSGEVRSVWAQPTGVDLPAGEGIFRIRFKVLQSGGLLSEALRLEEDNLPAEAYTATLETAGVKLAFFSATNTGTPAGKPAARLLQNHPNPFNDHTTINFTLPESCDALLRVLDVNGRELLRIDKSYPAGYNTETIRLDGFNDAGVLFCELTTPFGPLSRKMVKMK